MVADREDTADNSVEPKAFDREGRTCQHLKAEAARTHRLASTIARIIGCYTATSIGWKLFARAWRTANQRAAASAIHRIC